MKATRWIAAAAAGFALAFGTPAMAGATLDGVKSRGVLACGVNVGVAGFSLPDSQGVWRGMDADLCRAVAAAVLGGASFSGGAGSILGSALGVLLLALIQNGFVLLNLSIHWQNVATGLVLLLAIAIDALRRRHAGERA